MKINISGLKKLEKKFEKMTSAAEELERGKNVQFTDLFTSEFLNKYTRFQGLDEMLQIFGIENQQKYDQLNPDSIKNKIQQYTDFDNWEELSSTAAKEYALKSIGFN